MTLHTLTDLLINEIPILDYPLIKVLLIPSISVRYSFRFRHAHLSYNDKTESISFSMWKTVITQAWAQTLRRAHILLCKKQKTLDIQSTSRIGKTLKKLQ